MNEENVVGRRPDSDYVHFYTYLPEKPVPVAGPITVYWASGSSGKKCGVLKVTIGHQINDDLSSRGTLAELAAIYHYWCDQIGGTRIRDGRNLTFHATNADALSTIIAMPTEGLSPAIIKASRVLAIRFMDAFVRNDSKEFFEKLMENKPLTMWDRESYNWYKIQKPTIHMHGLGKVTLAYAPVSKWAHQKEGTYRRGAWKYIKAIAKDENNVIVYHSYDGENNEYISVFSQKTGTLFHCQRANGSDEIIVFDLQIFPAEERYPGKVVTINRSYGSFEVDITPVTEQ